MSGIGACSDSSPEVDQAGSRYIIAKNETMSMIMAEKELRTTDANHSPSNTEYRRTKYEPGVDAAA